MKYVLICLPFIWQNKALYKAEDHDIQLAKEVLGSEPYCFKPWAVYARLLAVRSVEHAKIGSMERRTFTFEQQSAQLDFIVQGNEFVIWYGTIIITKVEQKLSDLFQGTHSQTFNKFKKSLWPSPLLKLKTCFSRQVDVIPPQLVAAKVTVFYVTVHLNLKSVLTNINTLLGSLAVPRKLSPVGRG